VRIPDRAAARNKSLSAGSHAWHGFPVKMHADEVDIDEALVRKLLADQFPDWAGLEVRVAGPWGTDNALFRLGAELCVRLPRTPSSAGQVDKDRRWLPALAPRLPLALPEQLALGRPGHGYPFTWGVYRWLEGEAARFDLLADPVAEARSLAGFLKALQALDTADAPRPGPPGFGRGGPLAPQDETVRKALAILRDRGRPYAEEAAAAWRDSLDAAAYDGAPVWLHGDLLPGNLLVRDGALTAVIDCAGLAAGDPAVDLLPAWSLLHGPSRQAFRTALGADLDEDLWRRGRGWAVYVAVTGLSYYTEENNPSFVRLCRTLLSEVLAGSEAGEDPGQRVYTATKSRLLGW
jgi:aminoglycoside phosphotransferase (APT) family kinase protein